MCTIFPNPCSTVLGTVLRALHVTWETLSQNLPLVTYSKQYISRAGTEADVLHRKESVFIFAGIFFIIKANILFFVCFLKVEFHVLLQTAEFKEK